jgi:hypothetical protein
VEASPSECALLDNQETRAQMSASFELKLLRKCGRALPRVQSIFNAGGASRVPIRRLETPLDQVGATDILVNNPAADTGGHTTQSETSVVAVGPTVCAAWNDAGEGFGANGFSGFGYSLDGGHTFTDGGPFPNGPSDSRVIRASHSAHATARTTTPRSARGACPCGSPRTTVRPTSTWAPFTSAPATTRS